MVDQNTLRRRDTGLITYYRALSGEHENWDAYRAAMVTERRAAGHR
ncbi:MAG: hypothetical protein ABR926_15735 [Streptosporangiaceae bacterium]|jgi:hypothetical protein